MRSLIIGSLLFLASTLLGLSIKRIYRERWEIFKNLTGFSSLYEMEIKSRHTTLPEIVDIYLSTNKDKLTEILELYKSKNYFVNFKEQEVLSIIKRRFLVNADNVLLAEYFTTLGKNGIDIEMTNIERFQRIFEEKSVKYNENLRKNGEMYYKLFIVFGLAIMLIVV